MAVDAMRIVVCLVRQSSTPARLVITEGSLPDRNLDRWEIVAIRFAAHTFSWCVANSLFFPVTSADEPLIHSEEPRLHGKRRRVDTGLQTMTLEQGSLRKEGTQSPRPVPPSTNHLPGM